ncbi:MAG: bifunctional 23S rRNA (guanine(2069)-N(7))-methyltransferase RlmK/23S rRNA (guanine(2445)-N(2))-methyltransferase RlmL [Candidatus Competibacteraceae bacterium]|uniref:Ribosomal RNA large subunit methyltransferase K/L n=1 Tax=Candidatus Contendobacter odensis Run_B_J11 TaxID=1400861 RepID=A0A7U7J1S3_9GAMM|nr:bifunctional 23S rRNA (guanine(2069)-N(7))-methyltransferase RlmK/23S rRNA (guanine(2445)-N(2))-methyltransferase RlmL [Candidatus Contendobacter odensis]MBK8535599.1 bifunctional 23S rRNA (guanine(2069)-N(7))-methyltransferase RlmK/23S rRNA (guanine(2445)-N(2))-methyltransferase RlmL [Candidatus Competibacteraceae bacterium]MBK8755329.1 bifunctional 23S rRNA (guanine(2069)-N(7))-methyltransferase RlmK/23S rRNA (guanine(2445)-N(2))-methyltransferase RlmL [Candidatus Competibacteraceae bacteriu
MSEQTFFATAPAGVELLLAAELVELGAATAQAARGGILFRGPLELGYRACLWSRTASRVLLPLAEFPAADAEALYAGIHDLPWENHLAPDGTLSIEFNGSGPGIDHSHYGAQRVKDAIVDRFRARCGERPSIDSRQPDLRIHAHWRNGQVTVSLDLSGDSLHRRGYREATVTAPLKETLAAALLLKAGWPAIAAAGGPLIDPLCGSGTLIIEAAWMAGDHAPGLLRSHWGFSGWLGHVPALWNRLLAEADERCAVGQSRIPPLFASDHDSKAVRATLINTGRAGVADRVRVERREWATVKPPPGPPGLLIANPPYGERMGETDDVSALYIQLGERLKSHFGGWRAALFTGAPELGKRMGLRAHKTNVFYNGPLECRLLQFRVEPEFFVDRDAADRHARAAALNRAISDGADGFINRLRKNLRHLGRWAEREGVSCYRIYDADLPEYAVAIDRYEQWLHVQEYAPPSSIDPARAQQRLEQVIAVLPAVLELPPDQVVLKVRQRQKGASQYQKQAEQGRFHEVHEGPARLLVNFTDYLDTGLFLDHRLTRQLLREQATGRRFLNLFGYTGTATVHAALGGATSTTTVDLSATYLDWARRNLELNGIHGSQHQLIRADCRQWLTRTLDRYDLIFLDPPTFSNSRQLTESFDIQRDQVELLRQTLRLLAPGGVLIFSTNHRKFRLEVAALADIHLEDWSRRTLPPDFARDPKIHRCWRITQS